MYVSIFNDVVGPVMRGPSSSHCAAALRIGRIARDLCKGQMDDVLVEFDNGGSLPTTHQSQGSDMGLFGGLLGWDADDDRLPDSARWLSEAGIELRFRYADLGDPHPNTYRLTLQGPHGERHLRAISTGGGMIEVIEIDGVAVSFGGDYDETLLWTDSADSVDPEVVRQQLDADDVIALRSEPCSLIQIRSRDSIADDRLADLFGTSELPQVDRITAVLPVRSRRDLSVPFQTCDEMLAGSQPTDSLFQLAIRYESARSGCTETELVEQMAGIVRIVRNSIEQGIAGTHYDDRVLSSQAPRFQEALQAGQLIDSGLLNQIVLYTTALMDVKSSMGVIVAAPTAGACAAFPAVCLAYGDSNQLSDQQIAEGMLAGGLIGVFIATHWSFAAEVGGCQAEGGSAAAMSAAALVTFQGGTAIQATAAASMALQNMLGLICDPVANRVEVPCLGKNVMAASNAVSCANMSLAGFDAVIPLDETIAAAKAVSERMPREHRCTALGGLATTPTSIAIEERLKGCRACSG